MPMLIHSHSLIDAAHSTLLTQVWRLTLSGKSYVLRVDGQSKIVISSEDTGVDPGSCCAGV